MDDDKVFQLATLFRVLADPARLRVLGALAEQPHTGRELSERLGLTPPTVSHHMRRLVDAGIVSVTPLAQSHRYSLNRAALHQASSVSATVDGTASTDGGKPDGPTVADRERAKVLRDFFVGERLKQIPAQRKKRVMVLEHLLRRFDPGREYDEKTVNEMLRPAHEDVATLRRELVDYGFMNREHGIYRVAGALPPRGPTVKQEVRSDEHTWFEALVSNATKQVLAR